MAKKGKRYQDSTRRYDRGSAYAPTEALDLVKFMASARFDESVEAAFRLGVDPRRADQMLRGNVSFPHGTGKTVRVAVFAPPERHAEATEAGADIVGADDLIKEISEGGPLDFDVAIAVPAMMPRVGRLGRILGPRGLMPNPKSGTVSNDLVSTVSAFKAGQIEYRTDRYGNVHAVIGKVSFSTAKLAENLSKMADELNRARPAAAKGRYMRSLTISSTMGPGVKIDVNRLDELTAS
ncbi:MAG: 50S ribosomal protein L1 [bacterium]|nr:50S ribosomal protein L1 [bacterium]MDE0601992.1 50S ribosomal protein L1 [bacterium]